MEFGEAIRTVLGKYATFSGRAIRSEFWWWTLAVFIANMILGVIDAFLFGSGPGSVGVLGAIFSLAVLLPGLAVSVRRLHDLDKSGWWLLIILVPLLGFLLLLYWFVQRGTVGENQYGSDPLEGSEPQLSRFGGEAR